MNRLVVSMLAVVLVGVCLAGSPAGAVTRNVPAQYATIQAAIEAAVDGDVVLVAKGTYLECIDFKGKAITVKSTYETDPTAIAGTIIDGQKAGSVVTFASAETPASILAGFTITNGVGNGGFGGGVYCEAASATLTDNTLSGNSATDGGGVYCLLSSPTLINTIIAGNTAGGGLYCGDATCEPVVSYCDCWGNAHGNYLGMPNPTGSNGNLSVDPLFANGALGDFHLKSKGGRWNPATTTWVVDTAHSPCIDAGDPASAYSLEPKPTGCRINMGAEGNTAYASKSAAAGAGGAALALTAVATATSGGTTQIVVSLSSTACVQAAVLNIARREVAPLPARDLPSGLSMLRWNGRNTAGARVPSGVYLIRVTARAENGAQAESVAVLNLRR